MTCPLAAAPFECPEDSGRPREMERKGQKLFEEALRREPADPQRALEILLCVQRFADRPAVALRIGILAERLGKTELAVQSFERYLALAGEAAPDRAEMQAHIELLREKLPKPPPPASEPQPGPEPSPEPLPPDSGKPPIAGWALAAGGGAVMVLGGVLLFVAKQRSDDVHDTEPGSSSWRDAKPEYEQAKREQTLGFLSLALGAAAATAGVVLIATAEGDLSAGASASTDGVRADVRLRF